MTEGPGRTDAPITVRAWGVAEDYDPVRNQILTGFRSRFPHIRPVGPGGLHFGGNEYNRMFDTLPLMQIAGGAQPDVLHMWFPHCEKYIDQRFLYPLDKYLERAANIRIEDGHLLETPQYLARLKASPSYVSDIEPRAPDVVWPVIRRPCPYAADCGYCRRHGLTAAARHQHVWALPVQVEAASLVYRRDLFRKAGLPDRPPDTLEQFIEYARKLTDPDEGAFGLRIDLQRIATEAERFLEAMGGQLAERDDQGNYRSAFDSEEAVEACYFLTRLFYEPFTNPKGKRLRSVVFPGSSGGSVDSPPWRGGVAKIGMFAESFPQKYFWPRPRSQYGYGPLPRGPGGDRGGTVRGRLLGVYAGLEDDERKAAAAWEWIRYFDGPEARRILARVKVERGDGAFLQPPLLKLIGQDALIRQVPRRWVEASEEAMRSSRPPLIDLNVEKIQRGFSKAVNQVWTSGAVQDAVARGDADGAKKLIRSMLAKRVRMTDMQDLGMLTTSQKRFRSRVAIAVAILILLIFVLVLRKVLKTFAASHVVEVDRTGGTWQFGRYKWAYIMLIPAVGSIALWTYYPLARGTVMAFQDYNVRGFSHWVGMDNFAAALFSEEFWYAMWVALKYVLLFALFGFTAPIVLAFLLTEVPRGKVLFRTIYYLPAVLSGIVVMFLWKGFYGTDGLINQLLNVFVVLLNWIPGVEIASFQKDWLKDPAFALLFVMLPVIWVGAGPGCLIYLAALKTIPEELYEAADIDGAGILQKAFHVAIPGIKGLILINFIGVIVGQMKGGGEFVLAMTQGGPYSPYGATEVVGLHIYWQAFGYLKFGLATAMAWILGSMLVGFTVLQMQRLSRMEFRSAASTGDA